MKKSNNVVCNNTADHNNKIMVTKIIAMITSVLRYYCHIFLINHKHFSLLQFSWTSTGRDRCHLGRRSDSSGVQKRNISRDRWLDPAPISHKWKDKGQMFRTSRISGEGDIRGTGGPPLSRLQRRKYSPVQARQNPGHSPSTAFLALDAPPRSSPSCFELSTCTGSLRCRVLNCPLTCYSIHVQHIRP